MARPFRGHSVLEQAKSCLAKAKSVDELRQAQSVVFPLLYGLTLQQTAEAIGKSLRWTSKLRSDFIRANGTITSGKSTRGGRFRQNLTPDQEAELLAPFFDEAKGGGIIVVSKIREALEKRLGRKVALASVYNLLHRNGWRKLAPDKRNPKADVEAQEAWKKNSRK